MTPAPDALPISELLLDLQLHSGVMVALFDTTDRLRFANDAFRGAYALTESAQPLWDELVRANFAAGVGEVVDADSIDAWLMASDAQRRRLPFRARSVEFCDGRSVWMTETTQASGWLMMLGTDVTALSAGPVARLRQEGGASAGDGSARPWLGRRETLRLLQRTLASNEAWPLCLALLALDDATEPGARHVFAERLQAGIRQEDGSGMLAEGEYLLLLPTAGLGQGRAVVERLLARTRQACAEQGTDCRCSAGLIEARWGEPFEQQQQRLRAALDRARQLGGDQLGVLED